MSALVDEASQEENLDRIFHALSDRTRRGLIRRLSEGPAIITELAEPFEMSLAAVSKHLRVLEGAKLVSREVDGRFHRCTLTGHPMLEADRWLREYTAFWEDTLGALADYVSENAGDLNA